MVGAPNTFAHTPEMTLMNNTFYPEGAVKRSSEAFRIAQEIFGLCKDVVLNLSRSTLSKRPVQDLDIARNELASAKSAVQRFETIVGAHEQAYQGLCELAKKHEAAEALAVLSQAPVIFQK